MSEQPRSFEDKEVTEEEALQKFKKMLEGLELTDKDSSEYPDLFDTIPRLEQFKDDIDSEFAESLSDKAIKNLLLLEPGLAISLDKDRLIKLDDEDLESYSTWVNILKNLDSGKDEIMAYSTTLKDKKNVSFEDVINNKEKEFINALLEKDLITINFFASLVTTFLGNINKFKEEMIDFLNSEENSEKLTNLINAAEDFDDKLQDITEEIIEKAKGTTIKTDPNADALKDTQDYKKTDQLDGHPSEQGD